jgi:hypothetical protein
VAIDGWIHFLHDMITMMVMACVTAYVFMEEIPGKDLVRFVTIYIR